MHNEMKAINKIKVLMIDMISITVRTIVIEVTIMLDNVTINRKGKKKRKLELSYNSEITYYVIRNARSPVTSGWSLIFV